MVEPTVYSPIVLSECAFHFGKGERIDQSIRELLTKCFPHCTEEFKKVRWLDGQRACFTVVVEQDYKIVSHIAVIDRTMMIGDCHAAVAAVALVGTDPDYRNMGLCRATMTAAMTEADRRGFDIGMLLCTEEFVPLYTRLGWVDISEPEVVCTSDDGKLPADRKVMYYPISVKNPMRCLTIDLQGPKF